MRAIASPFQSAWIVQDAFRIGYSGGLHEHDEVVVGVRQTKDPLAAMAAQHHKPAARR
ncbi:hypothetical protein OG963_00345 [Streptomyces sp. NBC_01707]|uniref:hypothetical protein n=1 Tax=unclassified Streptomyces TaxID=2593676 RepID=UPI002E112077|nr:hypothetical protein OG763_43530 [Streptomyces sp. NBC_01230]